jgi:ankyrin repeat protein
VLKKRRKTLLAIWGEVKDLPAPVSSRELSEVIHAINLDRSRLILAGAAIGPGPIRQLERLVYSAATDGDASALRLLLEHGAPTEMHPAHDPNSALDGVSALCLATRNKHTECVRLLLAHGADAHARGAMGSTPLHYAAEFGHPEGLRLLVNAVASVDLTDMIGLTPLHFAAANNHPDAIAFLLSAGANVNHQSDDGLATPSHEAAAMGHLECLSALHAGGADFMLLDEQGRTALDRAEERRHPDCVSFLQERRRSTRTGAGPSLIGANAA